MKRSTFNIALGGIVSALCIVMMFSVSFLPVMLYVFPMLCSVLMGVLLESCGQKTAWSAFVGIGILSLILCTDKESAMFYAGFFGFYPMVKVYLERIQHKILKLCLKLAVFNIAVLGIYSLLVAIFGLANLGFEQGTATWFYIVLLGIGNFVFLIYDKVIFALSKILYAKIISRIRFKGK